MPDMAQEQEMSMQDIEGVEDGEVASNEPVTTKIYIEFPGNDTLIGSDLSNFATDNAGDHFQGIEWINDYSAKLVYANATAATDALSRFSAMPTEDPLELRRAIALATHPHVELYVRQSLVTDMKEPGAASKSDFYNKYPAYRPDRPPRGRGSRGGRTLRGPRRGGQRGGSRPTSRDGAVIENFENFYDDDEASVAARRPSQEDLFGGRRREPREPRRSRDEDLMTGRKTGRLRDRSASPLRDGDGRFGFSDDQPRRQAARQRTPPPLPRRRSRDANENFRKSMRNDLFADKRTSTALTNGSSGNSTELFPALASKNKELFPSKVGHRYEDVDDRRSDETTEAFSNFNFRNQAATRTAENHRKRDGPQQPDLMARITGGPGMALKASHGRLNNDESNGFSFKGAGEGFSIRGASRDVSTPRPGGDDLFANKKKARDAKRWQEDLY